MHITWERNAFRGNEISIYILMSPPGLRNNDISQEKHGNESITFTESVHVLANSGGDLW